jgi:uncharacterized protein YycO
MKDPITFLDKTYSADDVAAMSTEELLTLRNLVATNIGVATIRSFKDHDTAVEGTKKALVKYESTMNDESAPTTAEAEKPKKEKKVKVKADPADRKLAKPAEVGYVKRPTRAMFAKVNILKQHTGAESRGHRWANYTDGMLMIDAIETEGCLTWDINNWSKPEHGLMEIVEPTDDEYNERRVAWFAKHDRVDPEIQKAEDKVKADTDKKTKAIADKAAADKAAAEVPTVETPVTVA